MVTVHDILERARATGQRLSTTEAGVLLSAAVRLASAQGATLRSRLVQLDEQGSLHLLPFDDQHPELETGYLAPELLGADAPRKSEPRVQVYAAGALGYELFTGNDPRNGVDGELPAPLGEIVRMALSPDRRERFGDLTQLYDAFESAQPRLPPEQERQVIGSVRARPGLGAGLEKEALAKLIAQLGEVQRQLSKLSAAQREVAERVERFEDGQRLAPSSGRRGPPVLVPLLAGLLGAAAVIAAAWALGLAPAAPALFSPQRAAPAGETAAAPPSDGAISPPADAPAPAATGATASGKPARAPATGTAASAVPPVTKSPSATAATAPPATPPPATPPGAPGAPAPATDAAPVAGAAASPTGAISATGDGAPRTDTASAANETPTPGAGAPARGDAAAGTPGSPRPANPAASPAPDKETVATPLAAGSGKGAAAPPTAAAPDVAPPTAATSKPRPARNREVSPAMMAHAVAQSQVKRGETALEQGRVDEAIASFHIAIENEAGNAPALRGLGTAYSMQSNESMAIQSYEEYLRLAPTARDAGEIRRVIEGLKARAKIGGGEEK